MIEKIQYMSNQSSKHKENTAEATFGEILRYELRVSAN